MAAAIVVHVILAGSIVRQPIDPHVPPVAPRFLTAPLYFDATAWPGPGADFFALYHGGLKVRRGESPYDLGRVAGDPPYFFRYIYSPLLAQTLGRGFTVLRPRKAYLIWLLAIELSLFAWLVVIWRQDIPIGARAFALIVLLLSQPYVLELHMGQFTFMAVSLAMAAAWLARGGGSRSGAWGSAALLAATLLKTFPAVTLSAYVRDRRAWRVAAGGIAGVLVVLGPALAGGGRGHLALGTLDSVGVPHPGAESLLQAAFLLVLGTAGTWIPTAWPLVPPALLVLILAVVAVLIVRRHPHGIVTGAAAMAMAFFLGYQHAWEHHYSAVILAGTLAFVELSREADASSRRRTALLAAALVFLALPSPYLLVGPRFESWTLGTWLLMSLSKAAPTAIALYAVLARPHPPIVLSSHPPILPSSHPPILLSS